MHPILPFVAAIFIPNVIIKCKLKNGYLFICNDFSHKDCTFKCPLHGLCNDEPDNCPEAEPMPWLDDCLEHDQEYKNTYDIEHQRTLTTKTEWHPRMESGRFGTSRMQILVSLSFFKFRILCFLPKTCQQNGRLWSIPQLQPCFPLGKSFF